MCVLVAMFGLMTVDNSTVWYFEVWYMIDSSAFTCFEKSSLGGENHEKKEMLPRHLLLCDGKGGELFG